MRVKEFGGVGGSTRERERGEMKRQSGRQKHSSRPPTRDTPLNLQMGASVYRALVCCPSAPKNQEGMSDGDGDGGWWMGMQRERNSRFVFVPFTQKPRRVIARSTPRR